MTMTNDRCHGYRSRGKNIRRASCVLVLYVRRDQPAPTLVVGLWKLLAMGSGSAHADGHSLMNILVHSRGVYMAEHWEYSHSHRVSMAANPPSRTRTESTQCEILCVQLMLLLMWS